MNKMGLAKFEQNTPNIIVALKQCQVNINIKSLRLLGIGIKRLKFIDFSIIEVDNKKG